MAYLGRLVVGITALGCLAAVSLRAEGEVAGETTNSGKGLGIGVFSRFPLNVSASIQGGYDDNVNTSSGSKQDSWFTTAGLAVGYDLGTSRTKLTLASNFGFTYYTNLASNAFEPNVNLTLNVTHKVSPRLSLGFTSATVYQAEPEFQYGFGTNRRAGNYFFTTDRIIATYLWAPRFATSTSYGIAVVKYDEIATGMFEDRVENTFGNEFRFLLWPTTNLVGEYRFQVVNYQYVSRDSTTHYVLAGFDHAFTARLSASFRGGAEFRNYDAVGQRNSPYFEGTVNYKLGKDTAVSWNTRYGIEEGDVSTNPSRKSFRTSVQGKRNITARISASLSMAYLHDDYAGTQATPLVGPPIINPAFTEDSFNVDLALQYTVTRYLGIQAGFDHTEVSSGLSQGIRDYSRNRVWGGVNVAF
jgi:hypothetical protein